MRNGHPRRRRSRSGDETGAVLVEFTLLLPLLVTLILAVYEGGVWFLNSNRMNGSIQLSARTIASQGRERMADNAGLLALRASSRSFSSTIQLNYVIVYNAGTQNSGMRSMPSTACINKAHSYLPSATTTAGGDATGGAECNIYTWAQIQAMTTTDTPGFTGSGSCSISAWDRFYCPTTRKNALSGANSPPDYVGVWVEGVYASASKAVFQTATVHDFAVFRVEPAPGS